MVLALLPGLSGCLTHNLWDGDYDSSNLHWPATNSPPGLYRSKDGKDVLVRYMECQEARSAPKERAYLLYRNCKAVEGGRKPVFVNPTGLGKLAAIPLHQGTLTNAGFGDETLRAFLDNDGRHFTLTSWGREIGTFGLPAYCTDDKVVKRAFLTPLTVTGDVIIVSAAVGSVVGAIWFVWSCNDGKTIDTHWKL